MSELPDPDLARVCAHALGVALGRHFTDEEGQEFLDAMWERGLVLVPKREPEGR